MSVLRELPKHSQVVNIYKFNYNNASAAVAAYCSVCLAQRLTGALIRAFGLFGPFLLLAFYSVYYYYFSARESFTVHGTSEWCEFSYSFFLHERSVFFLVCCLQLFFNFLELKCVFFPTRFSMTMMDSVCTMCFTFFKKFLFRCSYYITSPCVH